MIPVSPLRDYLYLAIILMIALAFVWDHISGIRAGVARQVASDLRVAQVAQKAVEAQKLVDARTAEKTTHDLQSELAALRAAAKPPPVVRLCITPTRRPMPPAAQPAGGAPSPAPAPRELPSLPQGAGAGIDVGAGVQLVAEAADVVAARDRACLAWARAIAK